MKVFKYKLPVADDIRVMLPEGARMLHVGFQDGAFYLWALVEPGKPVAERRIRMAGTGHPITLPLDDLNFISTAIIQDGTLVFHFFEVRM